MRLKRGMTMAVLLLSAAGTSGCAQRVAEVFTGGGGGGQAATTEWLDAKVAAIDEANGTVSLEIQEDAPGGIDLQAGRTLDVNIEHLDVLTGLDEQEDEILSRMSIAEVMRVRVQQDDGELRIVEIDPALLP